MKEIPSKERVKAITDMMYELGMYTQAAEIDRLSEAYHGKRCTCGPNEACHLCSQVAPHSYRTRNL